MMLLERLLAACLPRTFYDRPALTVAPALLGMLMVSHTYRAAENAAVDDPVLTVGLVVETEAYDCPNDPACWAYRRRTTRNQVMWGAPGMGYIYTAYRNHAMINATVENDGYPATVLVRALVPVFGITTIRERRGAVSDVALTNGPGKVSAALGINSSHNAIDLDPVQVGVPLLFFVNVTADVRQAFNELSENTNVGDGLQRVLDPAYVPPPIISATRIGLSQGQDLLWRYYYRGDPYVSKRDRQAETSLEI